MKAQAFLDYWGHIPMLVPKVSAYGTKDY